MPDILNILNAALWTVLSRVLRVILPHLFPNTLCFYNVKTHPNVSGKVALTIDDAFVRSDNRSDSMTEELQTILRKFGAKVTFFVTLSFSEGRDWKEREILKLASDGHELANHCELDRRYDRDGEATFEGALTRTDEFIEKIMRMTSTFQSQSATHRSNSIPNHNPSASSSPIPSSNPSHIRSPNLSLNSNPSGRSFFCRWFRAPSGRLSETMTHVLDKHGLKHVLTDCYVNDAHIPFPKWIGWAISKCVQEGSIIVLHMPEKGFRQWNIIAIEDVLTRLKAQGLRSVTLSDLNKDVIDDD